MEIDNNQQNQTEKERDKTRQKFTEIVRNQQNRKVTDKKGQKLKENNWKGQKPTEGEKQKKKNT